MRVNMSNFSKFLRNTLKAQDSNIQPYQLDNSKVWLKKASERHSAWIYMPLKWVARILNIEALTPIPNYSHTSDFSELLSRSID
jgi:hypothetical protein